MPFVYTPDPVYVPKPKNKKASRIGLLFVVELIVIGFLKALYGPLNDMGAGAIVFVLPLMLAYLFVASIFVVLPILAISFLKDKTPKNKFEMAVVLVAMLTNIAAAIWLAAGIVELMIKQASLPRD